MPESDTPPTEKAWRSPYPHSAAVLFTCSNSFLTPSVVSIHSINIRTCIFAVVSAICTCAAADLISSSISSRIAVVGKRMPMLIFASPGTVFSPITAANHTTVDQLTTLKVSLGLNFNNFISHFCHRASSFFRRDPGMYRHTFYYDINNPAAVSAHNQAVIHIASLKIKCSFCFSQF